MLSQPLIRKTEYTITDPQGLLSELAKTRHRGFAIDNMENEDQVRCAASPIFDNKGNPIAAISISGVSYRMRLERVEELGEVIKQASAEISYKLGYTKNRLWPTGQQSR